MGYLVLSAMTVFGLLTLFVLHVRYERANRLHSSSRSGTARIEQLRDIEGFPWNDQGDEGKEGLI